MAEERRRITFDNKIPLTWLLSSAGTVFVLLVTVLWFVATQSKQLDQLVSQSEKTERRNVERDLKLESVIRDGYDSKRSAEILMLRVEALEKAKK